MRAMRIIEARDHIAQAAFAAMRRIEAEAALCRLSRGEGARLGTSLLSDSAGCAPRAAAHSRAPPARSKRVGPHHSRARAAPPARRRSRRGGVARNASRRPRLLLGPSRPLLRSSGPPPFSAPARAVLTSERADWRPSVRSCEEVDPIPIPQRLTWSRRADARRLDTPGGEANGASASCSTKLSGQGSGRGSRFISRRRRGAQVLA
jgi:hypothetical protein